MTYTREGRFDSLLSSLVFLESPAEIDDEPDLLDEEGDSEVAVADDILFLCRG
jgi:hypothetical protein